jgi:hypothetical protein
METRFFFVDHLPSPGNFLPVMKTTSLKTLLVAFFVLCGFAAMDQASARRTIPAPVVGTPKPISPL